MMSDGEWMIVRMATSLAVFGLVCILFPNTVMKASLFFRPWVPKEEGMRNPHLVRLCGLIIIILIAAISIYVRVEWM